MIGITKTRSFQHVLVFINLEKKKPVYNLFLFQRPSGFTEKQKNFLVFTKEISERVQDILLQFPVQD